MIDALERVAGRPVSRETFRRLEVYVQRVRSANSDQNLVSASTLDNVWERHILDSAQLVRFEPRPGASWLDIGSGAGLPGIVIALLVEGPVELVEPRRLRAAFLEGNVAALEKITGRFDAITARAVAPLDRLLAISLHLAHAGTVWALPKGKSANSELAEARRSWQCDARSEVSRTDPDARVLVLSKVRAKSNR
jgi:16S rRNA (guanine527-N7)-methyltransferase